jgi:hypothetical protein
MRLDAILPIVQYLTQRGLLERVSEDPSGNDTYKLSGSDLLTPAPDLSKTQPSSNIFGASNFGFSNLPGNVIPSASVGQLPSSVEAVLQSIGWQVLSTIKATFGQTSTLLDLAKASSMRLEAMLPIIQYLTQEGLLERVLEDPAGNDTYRVTPASSKLIKPRSNK